MPYKIEKGIPMPAKLKKGFCNGATELRNVMVKMGKGDSVFLASKTEYEYFGNAKKQIKPSLKFRALKESNGWRIWRIE